MSCAPLQSVNYTVIEKYEVIKGQEQDLLFVTPFVINFILAFVFLSLFLFFRKRVPKVYEPRCFKGENAPESPPAGVFGWIKPTLTYSEERLFETHGLDAVMFIKFVKMILIIFALQFLFGWIVLFPITATGELRETVKVATVLDDDARTNTTTITTKELTGLSRLTMETVDAGSLRLIAQLMSVFFNSVLIYYMLHRTYAEYCKLRGRYLARQAPENYTVMIREIHTPEKEDELKIQLERLFPGRVTGVTRARITPEIQEKLLERMVNLRGMEKSHAVFEKTGERPRNKTKLIGGEEVDSIDWFTQNYYKLHTEVAEMQQKEWPLTHVAFVSFDSLASAAHCAQLVIKQGGVWLPLPAPEPRDVNWEWLHVTHKNRLMRSIVVNIFIFLLVIFWGIPVVAVSSFLTKLPSYGVNLPGLPGSIVSGFLPTLAIIIFFAILVPVITAIARSQGLYSKTLLDRSIFSKYFYFQVWNIFIVYALAGVVTGYIQHPETLSGLQPAAIMDSVARGFPPVSTFFINYIMLLSMGGHMMSLWRPGPLIVRWIFHKFLCKTPREFREAEAPGRFAYELSYATHLLIFIITLVYSTMAPFILLWALVYFGLSFLASRYNIIYVFIPLYEGGGVLWKSVFNRVCACLIIYQVTLLGMFSGYIFPAGSAICALLIITTIVFWRRTNRRFVRESDYGALDLKQESQATPIPPESVVDSYRQPSLQPPAELPEIVGDIENKTVVKEMENEKEKEIVTNDLYDSELPE